MANYTTGAQRYNKRTDKIFDKAKTEGRGLNGDSRTKGVGVHSPAMEAERKKFAIAKKMSFEKAKKLQYGIHQLGLKDFPRHKTLEGKEVKD